MENTGSFWPSCFLFTVGKRLQSWKPGSTYWWWFRRNSRWHHSCHPEFNKSSYQIPRWNICVKYFYLLFKLHQQNPSALINQNRLIHIYIYIFIYQVLKQMMCEHIYAVSWHFLAKMKEKNLFENRSNKRNSSSDKVLIKKHCKSSLPWIRYRY